MNYHLMSIGGIGMSGLALILQAFGHTVTGCDEKEFEMTRKLELHGIPVALGCSPTHITSELDVLVVSTGVHDNNPEILEALRVGKRVMRRIELLSDLMMTKRAIGIAGTHGKTSTSAMMASVFQGCETDPTCAVGGEVRAIGGNAKVGFGAHFIAEIDESDPLFAKVTCDIAVITNIEDDHVAIDQNDVRPNYHSSLEALHAAFRNFARNAKTVVYCADWLGLKDLLQDANLISYGLRQNAKYRAQNVQLTGGKPRFTLTRDGIALVDVELMIPGEHNVLNAVATLAVADLEGLDLKNAAQALSQFPGAGRRWEVIGNLNGALLIDDYAHNPTKIAAALAGAKTTGRRIRAVFQPHRVVRTARDWTKYTNVLSDADEVMILDIYAAGEQAIPGVTSERITNRMHELGFKHVRYWPDRLALKAYLLQTAIPNDLIVTLGAGDVTQILREVIIEHHLMLCSSMRVT